MEPKKWWLISDDDVRKIRTKLAMCQRTSSWVQVNDFAEDAFHTLDSGLHTTDAAPSDWKEQADEEA